MYQLPESAPSKAVPSTALAPEQTAPLDPDLRRLVDAWPMLPDGMRRAMLALLDAAECGRVPVQTHGPGCRIHGKEGAGGEGELNSESDCDH